MKRKLLFVTVVLLLGLIGCNKDKAPEYHQTAALSPELINKILQLERSIFQESSGDGSGKETGWGSTGSAGHKCFTARASNNRRGTLAIDQQEDIKISLNKILQSLHKEFDAAGFSLDENGFDHMLLKGGSKTENSSEAEYCLMRMNYIHRENVTIHFAWSILVDIRNRSGFLLTNYYGFGPIYYNRFQKPHVYPKLLPEIK